MAGAAIDCHELEPLPADHPLVSLPNVVFFHILLGMQRNPTVNSSTAEGVIDVVNGAWGRDHPSDA